MRVPVPTLLLLHLSLALAAPALLAAADAVPVTKVVLYSSGVGYYEHAGSVEGAAENELRFKTEQINDVLKSLVLQDLDGGRVGTVVYPSQAPLERTLKSFQVDITGNPGLAQLLNQLRGAKVQILAQTETITGTVLGCESRQKPAGDKGVLTVGVLNLVTAQGLRQLELEQVASLRLEDPGLQEELNRALAALAGARDQDKKPVVIRFEGDGKRRVRLGYVVEAPVWKTSYRLVLAEPDAKPAKAYVQGWAIVENQTESDWTNVDLNLVSGRPISFIQDLYRPLYAQRPVVEPPLPPGVRPVAYGGGREGSDKPMGKQEEQRAERKMRGMAMAAAAPAPAMKLAAAADAVSEAGFGPGGGTGAAMNLAEGVHTAASAAEQVGELFQYQVPRVSLPRQRSAMLPIIGDHIAVQRVSIYNPEVQPRHPLNGVWLENTSGKHLQAGPVTVFDGGAYAGDARIDNLAPGQKRLLSYALDVPMTVDPSSGQEERRVVSGKLVKGVLQLQTKLVARRTYSFRNEAERERSLVVEHRFRPGWKLSDTAEPAERTDAIYRFQVAAKAKGEGALAVTEELVTSERVAVVDLDSGTTYAYASTGALPQKVRDVLQKVSAMQGALIDAERAIQARQEQLNAITQEQNRLRENMRTVAQNSPYYQRLLQKLNDQESRIEGLQGEIEKLKGERDGKRKELEAFLAAASAE
jgi:hypothetical protein